MKSIWVFKPSGIGVSGFGGFWDYGVGFWNILGLGFLVLEHFFIRILYFGAFWDSGLWFWRVLGLGSWVWKHGEIRVARFSSIVGLGSWVSKLSILAEGYSVLTYSGIRVLGFEVLWIRVLHFEAF